MGNRAVIATREKDLAVYLHWNGGRDSVEAFLKYCELAGYRAPDSDNYGWARLAQVTANFFPDGMCVGVDTYNRLKNTAEFDNGVYIIEGWQIVDREGFEGSEQMEYPLIDMLRSIDVAQPHSIEEKIAELEKALGGGRPQ